MIGQIRTPMLLTGPEGTASSGSGGDEWTDQDRDFASQLGFDLTSATGAQAYRDWQAENASQTGDKQGSTGVLDTATASGEQPGGWGTSVYGPGVEPDAPNPYNQFMWGEGFEPGAPTQAMQQYNAASAQTILNGMTTAELDALEREFYRAGYWDEDDQTTFGGRASMIGTFGQIIVAADNNRVSWEKQMEGDANAYAAWQEAHPEEGKAPYPAFSAPVYLKPDYATLAQRTKLQLRNNLGRDPTSTEMTLLTQHLGQAKKDEWQANTYDTAYADWQTRARAYESEENQMASPTVQGVDAEARFSELFDQRYENELDHRQRVDTSQRKSSGLFSSIDTISRMTS